MAPYVGEIRMFAGNFAPAGWMICAGQLLPISEYETLFNLIGTTYGGDGQETYALPDLRGRVPIHMGAGPDGTNYQIGEAAGVESVTLTVNQMPVHSHPMIVSGAPAIEAVPLPGHVLASTNEARYASSLETPVQMNAQTVGSEGGSQPHENMMPFVTINFIISLFGIFPSPT
jgi:microcystin-dependent protein